MNELVLMAVVATHHAATGHSGGALSPVCFALAMIVLWVALSLIFAGVTYVMHLCGAEEASEMRNFGLTFFTKVSIGLMAVGELILCPIAALGYLPWTWM